MAGNFPVARSVFDGASLRALVEAWWEIGRISSFELESSGPDDEWRLSSDDGHNYALRAWRAGSRVDPDIAYGLEALGHLAMKGVGVTRPVARKDGEPLTTLRAPEGDRVVALFARGTGRELDPEDELEAFRYGKAEALLHVASADFRPKAERRTIDLDYLLSRPLDALAPLLSHRPADLARLRALAAGLRGRLEALPLGALDRGFCHGDLSGANATLSPDGSVSFRGFSHCGSSWRSWDLAAFRHARLARASAGTQASAPEPMAAAAGQDGSWAAFLRGYEEIRQPSRADLAALPLFVCARQLVLMARERLLAQTTGAALIAPPWLDRNLSLLWSLVPWQEAADPGPDRAEPGPR